MTVKSVVIGPHYAQSDIPAMTPAAAIWFSPYAGWESHVGGRIGSVEGENLGNRAGEKQL